MAYEEPKDPLTGKGKRHVTASMKSVMGLGKSNIGSIIDLEEQERKRMMEEGKLEEIGNQGTTDEDYYIKYEFNMSGYNGKLKGNRRFTVIKIKLDELEGLGKVMGLNNLHKKLFYSDILSQKIFEKYPEWGRTREVMHLGIPDYFYYEKGKALVAVYDRMAFLIAPLVED